MFQFRNFLTTLLVCWSALSAKAQLYDGQTLKTVEVNDLTSRVSAGTILILGENHGLTAHRDQHVLILNELRKAGLKVSVGLEFVNYTDQVLVDQYREGLLDDGQFLSAIQWTGYDFKFYKEQLQFPQIQAGEYSLGLNIPRAITSKISKMGLSSLSEAEHALLPPHFELGRESYKKRFYDAAGAHCPQFENCFAAQSAWDDTMAWTATKFIQTHPEQVLVIIVGEFHAQFGGGLANRIRTRFPSADVQILSQIWAEGMTDEEINQAIQPSPVEGPRGDFIWVSGQSGNESIN